MNLKRLELRGFKTFAQRTEFVFPDGITALIGPNGSGKSNVADAIRWVLGEQSIRAVRGKRTEDVIFAGTPNRAPAGMAEVALTLDNASGWLPIAFSEVTIGRRAYRSGDNEYLINGSKVRLRDLNDLLLKAGLCESTCTVIGQGMVDLALSLRAEERRALIDEAADTKRFLVKLAETRDKLAVTAQALARAADLVAEISPRLALLSDQAAKLRQHNSLSEQLRFLLRLWYQQQRHHLLEVIGGAEARLSEIEGELVSIRRRQEQCTVAIATLDREDSAERDRETALRGQAEEVRRETVELGRRHAVLVERQRSQTRREADLRQECATLRHANAQSEREVDALALGRAALEAEIGGEEMAIADLARRHAAELRSEEELAGQLWRARGDAVRLDERAAALDAQRKALLKRRDAAAGETRQWQEARANRQTRGDALNAQAKARQEDIDRQAGLLRECEKQAAALAEDLAGLEASLQQLGGQARQTGRDLDEHRARLDVLERWRDGFAAYSSGVRTVLQNAIRLKGTPAMLEGIVGVAANLLRVAPELETAIEVSLGGRAQDVVVERWKDAEAAIALLKRNNGGRATFLPLDTLKVQGRGAVPLAAREQGVRGVAADLVTADQRFRPVVEHLLGRTLVAENLETARRILPLCPSGWQIVTMDGEIVRSSGAVTGGSRRGSDVGLLARQRELAMLQSTVAKLEAENAAFAARGAAAKEEHAAKRRELATLNDQRREGEAALRKSEAQLAETKAGIRGILDEQRWADTAAERQVTEVASLNEQLNAIDVAILEAMTAHENTRQRGLMLEEEQARQAESHRSATEALGSLRTALAVKQRDLASRGELLDNLRTALALATRRSADKENQLAAAEASGHELSAEVDTIAARLGQLKAEEARIADEAGPLAAHLEELRARRRSLEEEVVVAREQAALDEAARREAVAELGRLHEQVSQAQQQAAAELGPALTAEIWSGVSVADPEADRSPPDDLKRRLDRARTALRSLGMVNPEAIAEHEAVAARHEFLSREMHDLEEASKVLEKLCSELQRNLRLRFEETFEAVAAEFRRYFTRLFGGGSARLVLTQPDDIEQSGIDVVAQPPGRRLQSLSLLSGGERALTAVALLFAVLAVRPIPFSVLDEVDAALDEANVGRFGEALRELANRTQFLVVTHNRGTMQVADSLYGVSMPTDSVSQVVSLRLGDVTGDRLQGSSTRP